MLDVKPWFWAIAERCYRHKSGKVPYDSERETYECLVLMDMYDACSERTKAARSRGFSDEASEDRHKHNRAMLARAGVGSK